MLSIDECWAYLESQVDGSSSLPPGVSASAISEAEAEMEVKFPDDFQQLLLRHNGSGRYSISPYKTGGGHQTFMALHEVVGLWRGMVEVGIDLEGLGDFGEQSGPIKHNYWNKRWIPFTDNGCGDNLILDLDPAEQGNVGQVVDWWHEGAVSTFQSSSLREWLNEVVAEVRNRVYKFGSR